MQAVIKCFICIDNILPTVLLISEAARSSLCNPGSVAGISDEEKAEKATPSSGHFTEKLQVNSMTL